ncbi:MAG: T9SS type A sorting domain-containing protein [Flavobacteriales bacterium]|nr:T9SS type A sorting domain-containing protein [Flavobacteriales bacterium]
MKKNAIVFFSLISTFSVSAQEVISTQGDSYANANGSLDFTIGETIINTETDGVTTLTQGFHQSSWNFVGLEDHSPELTASVFPNPMDADLTVQVPAFENLSYSLYDGQGKLVSTAPLLSESTIIEVQDLAPGNYSISLHAENEALKTFKLIKTN